MKTQVLLLSKEGIVDTSFIGLDSTPVSANTSQNNPKSFLSNKFNPEKQPNADPDCRLGVHTASNQTNEKKYEFYWGYKNHVLVDCISGLPIYEMTTTAEVHDATVALDILAATHSFQPITECTFLADKGYDVTNIYNKVKELYNGECIFPALISIFFSLLYLVLILHLRFYNNLFTYLFRFFISAYFPDFFIFICQMNG